jgi:hypothetical protein
MNKTTKQHPTTKEGDTSSPLNKSYASFIPSDSELIEIAKRWHLKIHKELSNPILPEDLSPEVLDKKRKEISRQREKHKIYYRVLKKTEKLIRNNKQNKGS